MSLRLSPGREPVGAFAPTGPPLEARSGHMATALPDCRVLIVGGAGDGDDPLASIEVHDADARSFSPAGSLAVDCAGHTATLLSDGRILVAGGDGDEGSAELYDPDQASATRTGRLTEAHGDRTASREGG